MPTRAAAIGPPRSTSRTAPSWSAGISHRGTPPAITPATATMASSPPNRSSATATAAPSAASSVVSATWATTPPGAAGRAGRRRPGATTSSSSAAGPERVGDAGVVGARGRRPPPTSRPAPGRTTVAAPMPRAAPVTTATRPPPVGPRLTVVTVDLRGRCRRQPATTAARSAAAARIRSRPSAAVAPAGSPSTPLGLTDRTPPASEPGEQLGRPAGRRRPRPARGGPARGRWPASARSRSGRRGGRRSHRGHHAGHRRALVGQAAERPGQRARRCRRGCRPAPRGPKCAAADRTELDQQRLGGRPADREGAGEAVVLATRAVGHRRGDHQPRSRRPRPPRPRPRRCRCRW